MASISKIATLPTEAKIVYKIVPFFSNLALEFSNPFFVIFSSEHFIYFSLKSEIFIHGIFPFFQYSFFDLEGVPPDIKSQISPNFLYGMFLIIKHSPSYIKL